MDLENSAGHEETIGTSEWSTNMDLNDFEMPSDISSSTNSNESENSRNDRADSSNHDYEFLPSNSVIDPVQLNTKDGFETIISNVLDVSTETIQSQVEPVSETTNFESDHVSCDWDTMSQCLEKYDLSDDDSIEILEREIARPNYALAKIDDQARTEVQPSELMTSSLITVNKHVQTIDNGDSAPSMELQPIKQTPSITESSNPFFKSKIQPWIFDCLFVGAIFTSLILLYYLADFIIKDYGRRTKPNANEASDAVMDFMVHVVRDFNNRMEELQRNIDYMAENSNRGLDSKKPEELKEYLRQDLAAMNVFFDRFHEDGNRIFANNKALHQQIEMLREHVYILNVQRFVRDSPECSLLPKSVHKLLPLAERAAPCEEAAVGTPPDALPVLCRDRNRDANLIFHRNHLVSVKLHSEAFYEKVSRKYEKLTAGEEAPTCGGQPSADAAAPAEARRCDSAEAGEHASAAFAQDCDNFSKNYRSNFCTESNGAECGGDDMPGVEGRVSEAPSSSAAKASSEGENGGGKALKMVNEFKTLIKKFKVDFENFYTLCMDAEEGSTAEGDMGATTDDESETTGGAYADQAETTDSSAEARDENELDKEQPSTQEPISGDWFFNLNEARAQLRLYYEKTVSGDWILKLGKAREKLRRKFGEYKSKFMKTDRKNKPKDKRWSKPATEQMKDNLKKFTSKWKSHFKTVRDGFVDNYNKYVPSDWQFDLKNRWFHF